MIVTWALTDVRYMKTRLNSYSAAVTYFPEGKSETETPNKNRILKVNI